MHNDANAAADFAARMIEPIAPLDGTDLVPAQISERPELLWVAVRDLRLDRRYQRSLSRRSVTMIRQMVRRWDWALCAPITVAEMHGGCWEVIDGQHRATAAATHGGIPLLPAIRVALDGFAARAAAFGAMNAMRRAVTPGQRHKAALAAGDPAAVAIQRAIVTVGARLLLTPPSGGVMRAGDTMAILALHKALERAGPDVLTRVLRLCVAAGLRPIRQQHIAALSRLIGDAPGVSDAAVVAALGDWDAILDAADLAAIETGETRVNAIVLELHRRITS